MEVTFLGTSGAIPTTKRNPSSIFLRREGDRFLFDVGEGTQRQMMRFSTGFDISTIFLTHLHGDHILGLPGLLQTLDFNERTKPLEICTPAGTGTDVDQFLTASGTDPDYPVRIRELTSGDVGLEHDEYTIQAFETEHRTRSLGYALVEAERKGRFDRERALELGVPEGPMFGRLHEGNSVELTDGTVIHPDQVVGDPRPGRRVVYTGDTRPTDRTISIASDADLLIHDAMFAQDRVDRARQTGHSTAEEAATVAHRADVKQLALTHVSSRYAGDTSQLLREASEIFDDQVFLPDDGRTISVLYPEQITTDD
ncbi:ribonuclease Z [Natronorubrum tibetense]|uniref:Ribonuclease Z n=1 Tax=Natronorubrum tibetense GA33 TaxID=1114856 RepID=L9VEB3_9EURY|nr:ribonuclease Z [Natronorubrum tibetense]ELY35520.1 ribonuclease Z [Natronorubrum tibetense GA33]